MRLTVPERVNGREAPAPRAVTAWLAIATGLAAVFLLDRSTGSAPIQHLYYLPIIFAGVRFRLRGAMAAAVTAILLYHLTNPRLLAFGHGHWDIVQVALFLTAGIITARLMDDNRRLHDLAMTDDLTGLHNLRSFETHLASMVRRCRDRRLPLALLVLDVDRLKALNDVHGHLAGAEAVRTIGQVIAARIPPDGVGCRYGGDEFVVALPDCPQSVGERVAEDLRAAVRALAPVLAGVCFAVGTLSISVGVVSQTLAPGAQPSDVELGETLFREGDRALYLAKASGRDRIAVL
jgi:diguanylate cyclase (GGDEF)-like protein